MEIQTLKVATGFGNWFASTSMFASTSTPTATLVHNRLTHHGEVKALDTQPTSSTFPTIKYQQACATIPNRNKLIPAKLILEMSTALSGNARTEALSSIPEWKEVEGRDAIHREFKVHLHI